MRRNPIELAAVATAAVPGLTPTAVSSAPDDPADFDAALLVDCEGKRWRVRCPRHAEASTRLETEFLVLRAFAPGIRAELPFLIPTVAGTVRQGQLSTFVYSHLAGATRSLDDLSSGSAALAGEIGAALAAIHDLPRTLVSNADLPSYTPNEFRQRRLNELDQAATTGKIPPLLLRRWEHAMEDVTLWRFNPCVVHGDLHEDNILVEGDRVTAVTGWTDLRIGDPADDMAWLVASNEQDFVNAVLEHYTSARRDVPDAHLLRRAALSAEFALAQYLVKGLAAGNQEMIGEAESMLAALADDVAVHGGQPISVEPLPRPVEVLEADAERADAGPAVPAGSAGPAAQTTAARVSGVRAVPAVQVTPIPLEEAVDHSATETTAAETPQTDAAVTDAPDAGTPDTGTPDAAAPDAMAPAAEAPDSDAGAAGTGDAADAVPAAGDVPTQSIAVVEPVAANEAGDPAVPAAESPAR
ncbi:macrolide 2'-phosphotransferase [Arthrobacter sp. PM3]|uniref:macrolide 2'-phosphotransferase n=1 Tax=Arthrobacter sp. PM3 TaxID=2017685 RepID=UPI000E109F49|nr:macrolide 2'-phosphotransferase [Arthrobacter sp. PM3]AXJ11499.1 aminoglycoside phosphotransferase [Arthrobacter sp. PM3]